MARYVYHGRKPSDGPKWADSIQGIINGTEVAIYEVALTGEESAGAVRSRSVYDLPGGVTNERVERVTGGFTAHIGAAIKFHESMGSVGAVFVIDRDRLADSLTRIEYGFEWAEDHPGTYGRIAQIDDFEIYEGRRLVGAGYHRDSDGEPIINRWGEKLRDRINDFHYGDEAELAAYGTDHVNFASALHGTASYFHTERVMGGSIQQALADYPGYTMGFAGRGEQDVGGMTPEEMARAFQRAFVDDVPPTSVIGNSHMVVIYSTEDPPGGFRMRDGVEAIPDERFELAFDGSTVYRDPDAVRPYVGGNNALQRQTR